MSSFPFSSSSSASSSSSVLGGGGRGESFNVDSIIGPGSVNTVPSSSASWTTTMTSSPMASSSASSSSPLVSTEEDSNVYASLTNNSYHQIFENLTDWQKSKLMEINHPQGIQCLIQSWLRLSQHPIQGLYCDVAWDEIYCWPATPAGQNVSRPCAEIMKDDPDIPNPDDIAGNAFRICSENGTWLWGQWTNYNFCMESLEGITTAQGSNTVALSLLSVRYIYFVGAIISFLCLFVALVIFYYFKSIRCDRIIVHTHLMISLALRSCLMIIITEPFIFQRTTNYRTVDLVCKIVLALQLYATVASISWMFVQGHYLHGRVTTNVFDRGTPFRTYYGIGWGLPMLLVLIWVYIMEVHHPKHCWKNYGKLDFIWIIVGPMIVALVVNLLFLINIMRILLTKIQLATISSDSTQFRRAAKATVVLFPLFGATNLLFLYNPGGGSAGEAAYMITNTILQSSQGLVVATLYCFISKEVRDAIRRKYRRFTVKRSATSIRMSRSTRRRRSSYYGNNTTNSIYSDAPSTTTMFRTSIHRRASTVLTRVKQPGSSVMRSSMMGQPTWTTRTSSAMRSTGTPAISATRTTTPSPETINFLESYVTVTYNCQKRNGSCTASSATENKSDSENNDILLPSPATLNPLDQGHHLHTVNLDPVVSEVVAAEKEKDGAEPQKNSQNIFPPSVL